jgi:hypothetical protein
MPIVTILLLVLKVHLQVLILYCVPKTRSILHPSTITLTKIVSITRHARLIQPHTSFKHRFYPNAQKHLLEFFISTFVNRQSMQLQILVNALYLWFVWGFSQSRSLRLLFTT